MRSVMLRLLARAAVLVVAAGPADALAQDLGHRVPGTVGLHAGDQPPTGVYIADQLLWYTSDRVRNAQGEPLPIAQLDIDGLANGIGLAGVGKLGVTYWTLAASAAPVVVNVASQKPQTNTHRFGIADVRVQPLGVGWRFGGFDVISSYALYIPTGRFRLSGDGWVTQGSFTEELSLGGAYALPQRRWFVSALSSYDLNHPKIGIDIRRGDTVQIQWGTGVRLFQVLEVGVAGYALWQVTADAGADIPQALLGRRDRTFGLGPEVGAIVPQIHLQLSLRYEHDFGVRSRPEGQIVTLTLGFAIPA